jgi:hypothetical protein
MGGALRRAVESLRTKKRPLAITNLRRTRIVRKRKTLTVCAPKRAEALRGMTRKLLDILS